LIRYAAIDAPINLALVVTTPSRRRTLILTPQACVVQDDDIAVVLDPAWTPDAATTVAGRLFPVRDTVDGLLRELDPIVETSSLLDEWASRSGVVEALTIGSTSFWYYVRLRHWLWLQERLLWAHVLRRLLDEHKPSRLVSAPGTDPALTDVARLMAEADGLELVVDDLPTTVGPGPHPATSAIPRARPRWRQSRVARHVGRLWRRAHRIWSPPEAGSIPSLASVGARFDLLAAERERRLLIVLTHAPQRVETPDGPRLMNPYLGSVADRLEGSRLDPILLDWQARLSDPAARPRFSGPGTERILPRDVVRLMDQPADPAVAERASATARAFARVREPIATCGIDLGPSLARDVAESAAGWFPAKHATVARLERLIRHLHVAGVLVADEYHRQDWVEAASRVGVPVAAIQHGTINRHHRGYIHATRPPQLHLVDRTYLFGRWERDRLVCDSVYRDDEVVVGGSPRLDPYRPEAVDRAAMRRELGVSPDDRMVVLSGTWGEIYRRFHYPAVLARLFDRPVPRVHLVVKLHPGEQDEGPYRAVIEGVAAARGFAPPPITVVQRIDLYELLGAADAHLGVHSTVLTEAVFVGTPNLISSGVLGGDLLDYVEAGVALPVTTGEDLLAALEAAARGAITDAARSAFIARHFEPGVASNRIADDLLAWLG
jgi:hypothetical protein